MFCPKCGAAEQSIETYCRNCGVFLPDFAKAIKKQTTVEEHIKVNSFFTIATAIVSLSLAITLYATLGFRPETPWIIYFVAAFLTAMTAWQVQTFIRTRMLKRQFEKLRPPRESATAQLTAETNELLPEGNFEHVVPASFTERTTRNLSKIENRSS